MLTLRFSGGAVSAFKLEEQYYLTQMRSRRQLQALIGCVAINPVLTDVELRSCTIIDRPFQHDFAVEHPKLFH